MNSQSIDTNINTENFLISLIKDSTTTQKFSQICSLSQMTRYLSKRAIARANSNLTEIQVKLLFVKYHYGNELANKLEEYLKAKQKYARS